MLLYLGCHVRRAAGQLLVHVQIWCSGVGGQLHVVVPEPLLGYGIMICTMAALSFELVL